MGLGTFCSVANTSHASMAAKTSDTVSRQSLICMSRATLAIASNFGSPSPLIEVECWPLMPALNVKSNALVKDQPSSLWTNAKFLTWSSLLWARTLNTMSRKALSTSRASLVAMSVALSKSL